MATHSRQQKRRRRVISLLQIALVLALLVTTMGASGIFAFIVCPGCVSMRVPDDTRLPPPTATTTEPDKDKKDAP
jgi:hypothetical protein